MTRNIEVPKRHDEEKHSEEEMVVLLPRHTTRNITATFMMKVYERCNRSD
jgi:hypothetical protein